MKRSHDYTEPEVVERDPKAKALSYLRRCGEKVPFIAIDLDYTVSSYVVLHRVDLIACPIAMAFQLL